MCLLIYKDDHLYIDNNLLNFYISSNICQSLTYNNGNLLAICFESSRVELLAQRHFRPEFTALVRRVFCAFIAEEV